MEILKSTNKLKKQYIKEGFIELTYSNKYEHPIQAKYYKEYFGKIKCFHYFAEWNNFNKAIEFFTYKSNIKRNFRIILINKQISLDYVN